MGFEKAGGILVFSPYQPQHCQTWLKILPRPKTMDKNLLKFCKTMNAIFNTVSVQLLGA
jgi:hypothetical protein